MRVSLNASFRNDSAGSWSRRNHRGATAVATLMLLVIGNGAAVAAGLPELARPEGNIVVEGFDPIVVVAPGEEGRIRVEIKLDGSMAGARIAGFRGELQYDPQTVTISRAELPDGVVGGWNPAAPDRLRFVGASVDALESSLLIAFEAEVSGSIVNPESFRVRIDELKSADGFIDLTDRIVASEVR